MAVIQYLLIGLAFGSRVFAAECSTSGTTTIIASADATALASCTTYSGSVAIQTSLSTLKDSNGHQQIQIDKLQKIDGNLTITDSSDLAQITFSSLREISGAFLLSYLPGLASVNLPALNSVNQMNLTALPLLQALNFGSVGVTKARSILITNTGLGSLEGLNNLETVDALNINNNQALQNVTLKMVSVKTLVEIVDNNGLTTGLNVNFPLLQTAQNMTFRNCSDIKLPALRNVTDDLGFYGNDFEILSAPNFTTCRSLVFVGNPEVTNISFPSVTSAKGTFLIANNTKLNKIDGFQNLEVVEGALDFSGNFTEVALPALTQVRGAFTIITSGQLDCSPFQKLSSSKAIKGKFKCTANQQKQGTAEPSSTDSGGKSGKTGAAIHFEVSMPRILCGSSVIAAFLQFFL